MLDPRPIRIKGAGVAGLCCAVTLLEHGFPVLVDEAGSRVGSGASWKAGGMLAPWCESETSPEPLDVLAARSIDWWQAHFPSTVRNGTLVVAATRDSSDLSRFARRTRGHEAVGADRLGELEPALANRFGRGLFFAGEGHLDPREALQALAETVVRLGGVISLQGSAHPEECPSIRIDSSGFAAVNALDELRGVRGEMVLVRCRGVSLSRPVRMLHPRHSIYVVPRSDGVFMIGATMIESENKGPMTVRSAMDLLGAAYALNPAFADADILELAADLRPTFPSHMPEVRLQSGTVFVNGMYRHGFLLAPILADRVLHIVRDHMTMHSPASRR